jgi:3-oxoacyl-[acyl-carrier protein] reductase
MDLGIKGKNAIVGASSQGLGKACALEFAREGANVLICGRTEATLQAAHAEIDAAGDGQVISVVADLAEKSGQQAVIDAALKAFGNVDILVTNTGGPPPGKFETHDEAAWEGAYRLLLASAVALINGFLPSMKENQSGRIIAITSQAVKQPVDNLILSNSVRASVVGLCRTLANELGPYGITVNNVMPGYTNTDRLKKLMANADSFKGIEKDVPLGRVGEPDEFAAMVAFLASARASYITGVSVPVDGGWIKSLL